MKNSIFLNFPTECEKRGVVKRKGRGSGGQEGAPGQPEVVAACRPTPALARRFATPGCCLTFCTLVKISLICSTSSFWVFPLPRAGCLRVGASGGSFLARPFAFDDMGTDGAN